MNNEKTWKASSKRDSSYVLYMAKFMSISFLIVFLSWYFLGEYAKYGYYTGIGIFVVPLVNKFLEASSAKNAQLILSPKELKITDKKGTLYYPLESFKHKMFQIPKTHKDALSGILCELYMGDKTVRVVAFGQNLEDPQLEKARSYNWDISLDEADFMEFSQAITGHPGIRRQDGLQ